MSGLDAVELRLVEGRPFRIGMGDPLGLAAAIQAGIGSPGRPTRS